MNTLSITDIPNLRVVLETLMGLFANAPRGYNKVVGYTHATTGEVITDEQYRELDTDGRAPYKYQPTYETCTSVIYPEGTVVIVKVERNSQVVLRQLMKLTGEKDDESLGHLYSWSSIDLDPVNGATVTRKNKNVTAKARKTTRY